MEITASITGIKYQINLAKELKEISLNEFDINTCPSSCLISHKQSKFALSKWVSPKRTRTYPYERVYNTLSMPKKITIIPIVKDEGFAGDRDFIQWDTISLMSLLDVYVIFAYYSLAKKHTTRKDKISKQLLDNDYIIEKIKEIESYHSSALHWNLKEVNENIPNLLDKVKNFYIEIEKKLNVRLHSIEGIDNFKEKILSDANSFMDFSRQKAKSAQSREFLTTQPKESLKTLTKAKITIKNYLGGMYFLTVDEVEIGPKSISLIESKHTKSSILPGLSDIKDGLVKMMLFSNLKEVRINNKKLKARAVLKLTSLKLMGTIDSDSTDSDINCFFAENRFNSRGQLFIRELFKEANLNQFQVIICRS